MTDSNSVELFDVEFFLTENQTSKVEILLFWGFVLPSDFPKSGGDPVYYSQALRVTEMKGSRLRNKSQWSLEAVTCDTS